MLTRRQLDASSRSQGLFPSKTSLIAAPTSSTRRLKASKGFAPLRVRSAVGSASIGA